MSERHTPGPWSICFDSGRRYERCLIGGVETNYIAKLVRSPGDSRIQADGHLIAAAPYMLAALRAADKIISRLQCTEEEAAALVEIAAAIAKAEGRA